MRLSRIAEAVMGSLEYEPPADRAPQLMADFFLLEFLKHGDRHTESHRTDLIDQELGLVERKLLPALRRHLLSKVGYSVACELRHVFDEAYPVNRATDKLDLMVRLGVPARVARMLRAAANKGVRPRPELVPDPGLLVHAGLELFDEGKHLEWSEEYGGEPWRQACALWVELDRAGRPTEVRMAADRIYQSQHNTGNLLNKNPEYSGIWVEYMLDAKYNAQRPEDLAKYASGYMRRLAGHVLHNRYGRAGLPNRADPAQELEDTVEQVLEFAKSVGFEVSKQQFNYVISLPNGNNRGYMYVDLGTKPGSYKHSPHLTIQMDGYARLPMDHPHLLSTAKRLIRQAAVRSGLISPAGDWNRALRAAGLQAPGGSYWKATSEGRAAARC